MSLQVLDPDRVAFLENREKKNPVTVPAWPRLEKDLPQVEIEVTFVGFSTLNHRTRAEQLKMHADGRPDLFTADPLGPEAQEAQFGILCRQDGFEELKADLRERGAQDRR